MSEGRYVVQPLPDGDFLGARVVRVNYRSAGGLFVKIGKVVYHVGRHPLDLLCAYSANDQIRRAWCKLAGEKIGELKKARALKVRLANMADTKRKMDNLRRLATSRGYRLVKMKESPK